MIVQCDICETDVKVRPRPDGTPNIVGMAMKNDKVLNICYSCICKASYDKITRDKIKKLGGELSSKK